MADSYDVHLGFWTNWSQGSTFGATLTLTETHGNLLVAFIAFWVTLVGTRFWRLTCFILHVFFYSSKSPQDTLYHQRQAVLRNVSNAETGLYTLACLVWTWRRHTWRRLLPLLAFTAVCVAGWTVATGFSSMVSMGREVLISGSNCGVIDTDRDQSFTDTSTLLFPYVTKVVQTATAYVKQCYTSSSSVGPLNCDTFIQKRLTSSVTTNASCPFKNSICRSNDSNLVLDTGLLDSFSDLGINAPADQRFQYRKVVECAPLVTDKYKTTRNTSSDKSYTQYWYGSHHRAANMPNFTREFSNDALADIKSSNIGNSNAEYRLVNDGALAENGSFDSASTFQPIGELARYDADVFLYFLVANGVLRSFPSNDLWFHATTPAATIHNMNDEADTSSVYYPDEPASPLGCTEREQFCNPNLAENSRCTPLRGTLDTRRNAFSLFEPGEALNLFQWIYMTSFIHQFSMSVVIDYLGPQALAAKDSLFSGLQGPLPDNQWQIEVQHWHETALVTLQSFLINAAAGRSDEHLDRWIRRPNNTEEHTMCGSQKILSTAYTSFSVFGLLFIFIFGLLIILASWILPSCLSCLRRRSGVKEYEELEWCTNEIFQLQRLAHEEIGLGTWSRTTDFVPVTKPEERLAQLDLTDRTHPRLLTPHALVQVESLQKSVEDVSFGGDERSLDHEGHAESSDTVTETKERGQTPLNEVDLPGDGGGKGLQYPSLEVCEGSGQDSTQDETPRDNMNPHN